MIRLSKLTDYGIVLMTQMARHPERPFDASSPQGTPTLHTARELAAAAHIPLPTVSKLLKLLSGAGLLVSHRGVKGGYSLARLPQEISVGHVIAAIEGPIGVTECSGSIAGICELEPHCPMSGNWKIISNTVQRALEDLTLTDLISPMQLVARRSHTTIIPATQLATGRTQ